LNLRAKSAYSQDNTLASSYQYSSYISLAGLGVFGVLRPGWVVFRTPPRRVTAA
jgi:hypothetical protein